MKHLSVILALCALIGGAAHSGKKEYTYVDIVNRLTDLEALAMLPSPGERGAQWSSYDRRSKYDAETGEYLYWDANVDGMGFIREEGEYQVLAEIDGPGVIWRIWSALPADGHVKVFLDGSDKPALDLPFKGYFNHENEPFTFPALVYTAARGQNCYVPIPFAKSCKILGEKGWKWGRYYHFTYSTFPEGTKIPTFNRRLSRSERAALSRVNDFLASDLGNDPAGKREGELAIRRKPNLLPGRTSTIAKIRGPRAITAIRVKVDANAVEDISVALRSAAISIKWDGEEQPSVWAPLGDFFGGGCGINKYRSLPLGITDDGFYCLWYMPFAKSALIQMTNEGNERLPLEVSIAHSPLSRPIEELGRFHAKWHRGPFPPSESPYEGTAFPPRNEPYDYEAGRSIDWTMLITEGRGRFCGASLEVWNPKGGWWGEGDEKFFVDGEKFPSTFGTGTEDYFGYAWGDASFFEAAFHSQPRNDDNTGHISNNRWQIADNVPFQKSFEGYVEKYFGDDRPTLFACAVYWYLSPGGVDPYQPVHLEERFFYVRD